MEFLPDGGHAVACESGETMQRRPRRNHTPAFKARLALAAIKGDRTLTQLAEQFDVHPNQIASWKAQLESGAADVLHHPRLAKHRGEQVVERAEIEVLARDGRGAALPGATQRSNRRGC